MAQTVVGIFDTVSEAQNAVEELVENGFDRQNIDITSAKGQDGSNDWTEDEHSSFGDTVSNFFKSLFSGKDEAYRYSEVASRGSVVTVYTSTAEQAEDVADILDDCGAVDVDERANLTNTITTGNTTFGRTDIGMNSGTSDELGNITDNVTQYGDRANEDKIKTGTFQDPVGGDLDDRISSFADTTRTVNSGTEDPDDSLQNNEGSEGKSDLTTQRRFRSRIVERPDGENLRLWRNKDHGIDA